MDTFGPGMHIEDAAQQALDNAQEQGHRFDATFNGTPLIAYPRDTVTFVVERWSLQRRIYQLENH